MDIVNHVGDHVKLMIIKEMVIVMMETIIVDVNMMVVIVVIPMQIWITAQNVNALKLLHLMLKIRWEKFFQCIAFITKFQFFYSKLGTLLSSELVIDIRILLAKTSFMILKGNQRWSIMLNSEDLEPGANLF